MSNLENYMKQQAIFVNKMIALVRICIQSIFSAMRVFHSIGMGRL